VLPLQLRLQRQLQQPQLLLQLLLVRGGTAPASPAQYCLEEGWVHALLLTRLLLQAALRKACRRQTAVVQQGRQQTFFS
jgi:hypothetical protein